MKRLNWSPCRCRWSSDSTDPGANVASWPPQPSPTGADSTPCSPQQPFRSDRRNTPRTPSSRAAPPIRCFWTQRRQSSPPLVRSPLVLCVVVLEQTERSVRRFVGETHRERVVATPFCPFCPVVATPSDSAHLRSSCGGQSTAADTPAHSHGCGFATLLVRDRNLACRR